MRRIFFVGKTFFSSSTYQKRCVVRCSRQSMAKRITNNIITGNDPHLGMYLYYSPHFDQNIWRRTSSLTGERTKKDPAFKGFRQSSSRLKQASPIAGSLYKLVPKAVKEYALFRTLTGEAIKMLKAGIEESFITETLKKKYIDPILELPKKNFENITIEERVKRDRADRREKGNVKGLTNFTSYPQMPSGVRRIIRRRRSLLLQKITEGQSVEYITSSDSDALPQTSINASASPSRELLSPEKPKRRTKTTSGLIYLGRLPECKKLKIWLRPSILLPVPADHAQ